MSFESHPRLGAGDEEFGIEADIAREELGEAMERQNARVHQNRIASTERLTKRLKNRREESGSASGGASRSSSGTPSGSTFPSASWSSFDITPESSRGGDAVSEDGARAAETLARLADPPQNYSSSGDSSSLSDGGEGGDGGDVVSRPLAYSTFGVVDSLDFLDLGRVERAANELTLTRALFLPIVACPLDENERADPRCASMHKKQARALAAKREKLNRELEVLLMNNAQLTREIEILKSEQTSSDGEYAQKRTELLLLVERTKKENLTEIGRLKVQLEESEKEIAGLNAVKDTEEGTIAELRARAVELEGQVAEKTEELEKLAENEECSSRLRDLIGRALEGNVSDDKIEQYRTSCVDDEGAEQLKTILDRVRVAKEAEVARRRLEEKVEKEKAKELAERKKKLAEFPPKLMFLKNLKRVVAESEKKFTDTGEDSDFDKLQKDALKYGVEVLGMRRPEDIADDVVLSEEEIKNVSSEAHRAYLDIVDLIVQKSGNIRMMVRFNADRSKFGGMTVTKSYATDSGNALYFDPQRPFRGYSLDSTEDTVKTTLYCNRTLQKGHWKKLNFERVFLEEDQKSVYDSLKSFVFSAQNGKPLGIFAYGGTGSGKTHTLLGPSDRTEETEGILGRVIRDLWFSEKDVRLKVKMMEIHPSVTTSNTGNKEVNVVGAIDYRCLDLVYLRNNTNLTIDAKGQVTFDANTKTRQSRYLEFFELTTLKKQQMMTKKRTLIGGLFERVYEQEQKIKDTTSVVETFTREQFDKDAQQALIFDAFKDDIEEVMNDINGTIKYRRSVSTSGNKSGSSRSHLVITLEVTRPGNAQRDRVYVVDMAGKEYAEENSKWKSGNTVSGDELHWRLSTGINQSLDGFMRLVAVSKCKRRKKVDFDLSKTTVSDAHVFLQNKKCNSEHDFMPHVGDDDTRKVPSYVTRNGARFRAMEYKDDPMTFMTDELWTDSDAKLMLFACMYPLVQIKKSDDELFPKNSNPQVLVDRGEHKEDAWDVHFGIKKNEESLHNKFIRDLGILREMDYVQQIGKKYLK